jgi:hypothetical protein
LRRRGRAESERGVRVAAAASGGVGCGDRGGAERAGLGVVWHQQAAPVLNVISEDQPGRSVEVGCHRVGDRWWFVVEPGGEGVAPVDEVDRVPEVLVGILGRGDQEAGR